MRRKCRWTSFFKLFHLRMLPASRSQCVNDRMINEYAAVAGMGILWGKQNTPRKPAPVTLCPQRMHTEYRETGYEDTRHMKLS
jgi:hypothetical protein